MRSMKARTVNKKNITTIEGLATLVVEEISAFREEVNEQFSLVNSRLDRIEKQLVSIEVRVTALEMKVAGLQRRLDEEAMERIDIRALLARVAKLEELVYKK